MISVNNKIICEPYAGGKNLKPEVKSGFATVQQKNSMVGLKVLVDALVKNGNEILKIKANSTLYFSEEILYINQAYHNPIKSDKIKEPFVLADFAHVLLIDGVGDVQ